MSLPITRPTGNPLLDLFQRNVVDFLKEISVLFTRTRKGLVPPPSGTGTGTTRFLCEDGQWRVP